MKIRKNNITENIYSAIEQPVQLILTYFDSRVGPMVFFSSPLEINKKVEDTVCNLLDLNLPEGFFEYKIENEKLNLGNFIFEIPSKWARGHVESLMLSLVLKSNQSLNSIKNFLIKLAQHLKEIKDLYKAFYIKRKKNDIDVKEKSFFLISTLSRKARFFDVFINKMKWGKILLVGNKNSEKKSVIDRISSHFILSPDNLDKSNYNTLNLMHYIKPDKLILNYFLDQIELWIYDLENYPCKMWFSLVSNPISIIFVIDGNIDKESLQVQRKKFIEIVDYYCSEYSEGYAFGNLPILIVVNEKNHSENQIAEEKLKSILNIDRLQINSRMEFISSENNNDLLSSLKWIVSELLYLKK